MCVPGGRLTLMRGVVLAVAVVVALGSSTPYQRQGGFLSPGGYDDARLEEGRYFVEVKVNGYTSASTAMRYLHRRALDLCRAAGYDSYAIEDSQSSESVYAVTNTTGSATAHTYGSVATGSYQGTSRTTVIRKPETSAVIRCTGRRRSTFVPFDPGTLPPGKHPTPPRTTTVLPRTTAAGGWWCARLVSNNKRGVCARTEVACKTTRERLRRNGLDLEPCEHQDVASCFGYKTDGQPVTRCDVTVTSCWKARTSVLKRPEHSLVSRCRSVR